MFIYQIRMYSYICWILNNLQEANEFSERPIIVSSLIGEHRNKQNVFETSEMNTVKRLNNPQHWLLKL